MKTKQVELEETLKEIDELRVGLRDEIKKLDSLLRKARWIIYRVPQSKLDRYADEMASDRWKLYSDREGGYRDKQVRT